MYAPINQIQSLDDEDEDQNDVVQESSPYLSYYNHNFGQKCGDFACFNGVSTAPSNPFQFELAPPPKKRKSEAADGGGGRVVRPAGRKDRHSKVRTARGPRDRRVRLSPTTAIQFYDVQDRLGYDRPSKAIDWLIKEAKAAIDALGCEQQPRASNAVEDRRGGGFSLIMREKHQHLNDNNILDSGGFGCFSGEAVAAPPPPAAACLDQLGFSPALNSNWEMARLQKMFTWNSVNESLGNARIGGGGGGGGGGVEYSSCSSVAPPHAAAEPISGHVNLFREPLQSSIVNYSSINNDFGGFNFSNELSKIAASATPKQDENLKKLIFSNYQE